MNTVKTNNTKKHFFDPVVCSSFSNESFTISDLSKKQIKELETQGYTIEQIARI